MTADDLFAGSGEMRARCRALDWAATPLGPVEGWPAALRAAAGLVLGAAVPMVLLWGPELVQLYNDAYAAQMGDKHPAGLGQPTHACWPEFEAVNAPHFARAWAGETVVLENALFPLSREGRREDAWFTLSYSPVPDDAGRVAGVLVIVPETTAEVQARHAREAERERILAGERATAAELRAVLESMTDGVYIGGLSGITLANQAALDQLGFATREELNRGVGTLAAEIRTRDAETGAVIPTERQAFARALGGEHVVQDVIVRHRQSGEDRVVRCAAAPVVVDGRVIAAVAVNTDVTDIRRAAAERERLLAAERAARADAEAANRAKSEFLAVMSHELRTPLNAIGGYAELIELGIRGPVTEHQRADLARIQQSQRHLLGLISGVLDYSRVEAGVLTYRLTDVPVAEAVAEAETLVAPQLRAKGLGYAWAGAPPELRVRADREKLQQILLNLLGNAVKFTHPRDGAPGRVEVSCTVEAPAAGGRVHLHVRDTGLGIDQEKLERIFEPFVQIDQRLTRPHEGVGLGLAISRDLARGMGGDLTAASTLDVGSTFTLTLPGA